MRTFTKVFLGIIAAASFTSVQAQLQITAPNTPHTIDFNNFAGAGFSPTPAAGELDSDTWSVLGFDAGPLLFGGTGNTPSTDFARGVSTGGITTGGVYAFDTGGNIIYGIQPTGSDYTPGHTLLQIQNTSGAVIKDLTVSYDFYYQNNADRGNTWVLSYSTDTVSANFINTAAGDTTPAALNASAVWTSVARTVTLTNVNIPQNGLFYLRWSSNDLLGSGSRDEIGMDNIVLTATPLIFADFTANTACLGDTTMFTDQSVSNNGNITSWVWNFGDTNTAYVQNPWHIYDAAGTYNVQLVVTNSGNDADTTMMTVVVGGNPLAGFSSDVTTGCNPLCVSFTDTSDNNAPGTINTWMWDFGDGNTSTQQNPVNCYANAGTYDVNLIVATDLGCSDTVNMPGYITVNQSPDASFTYTVTGSAFAGTSTAPGNSTSFVWDMGEGTIYAGPSSTVTHNYTVDGTYNVCLIVVNGNGCSDTTCQTVNIITTGTAETTLGEAISIYPNPSSNGILTVDFGKYSGNDVKITVYNIIGKTVYERQITSNNIGKQIVSLQGLPSGNYFINILSGKETFTRRITINR